MKSVWTVGLLGMLVLIGCNSGAGMVTPGGDVDNGGQDVPAEGSDSSDGDAGNTFDANAGDCTGIGDDCGQRNARTLPANQTIEHGQRLTFTATPAGKEYLAPPVAGSLGGVFSSTPSCGRPTELTFVETLEVDGNGRVINAEDTVTHAVRFVIVCGCLALTYEDELGEDALPPPPSEDDLFGGADGLPGLGGPNLCAEGEETIRPFPLNPFPDGDQYFCVVVEENENCIECSEDTEGWTIASSARHTVRVTKGTNAFPIYDLCTGEFTQVDVTAGEEVIIEHTGEIRYGK